MSPESTSTVEAEEIVDEKKDCMKDETEKSDSIVKEESNSNGEDYSGKIDSSEYLLQRYKIYTKKINNVRRRLHVMASHTLIHIQFRLILKGL